MFQGKNLAQLRSRKAELISRSDANRQRLMSDWQRVCSSEIWLGEILSFSRRHPLWVVTLATAAGTLAAKTLRRPRAFMKRAGQVGKFAAMAFSAWKLFRRKKRS